MIVNKDINIKWIQIILLSIKVAMLQWESSTWHDNFLVQFLPRLEYCNTGNILEHFMVKILMRCNYNYMLHATNR